MTTPTATAAAEIFATDLEHSEDTPDKWQTDWRGYHEVDPDYRSHPAVPDASDATWEAICREYHRLATDWIVWHSAAVRAAVARVQQARISLGKTRRLGAERFLQAEDTEAEDTESKLDAMGYRLLGECPYNDHQWHVARWLLDDDGDRDNASVTVGYSPTLKGCIAIAAEDSQHHG